MERTAHMDSTPTWWRHKKGTLQTRDTSNSLALTPSSDPAPPLAHWLFEKPLILYGVSTLGRKLNFIFLSVDSSPSPPPPFPPPPRWKKKKKTPRFLAYFLPRYRNACSVKLKPMHFRLCNAFLGLMRLEWVQGSLMKTRLAGFTLFSYWGITARLVTELHHTGRRRCFHCLIILLPCPGTRWDRIEFI